MDIDWSVLEEAGVPESQLARFVGVSRPAVLYWKRGVSNPSADVEPKVKAFLAIVAHAHHNDLLGAYKSARKPDRQRLLTKALLEARQQMKEKRNASNNEGISRPDPTG